MGYRYTIKKGSNPPLVVGEIQATIFNQLFSMVKMIVNNNASNLFIQVNDNSQIAAGVKNTDLYNKGVGNFAIYNPAVMNNGTNEVRYMDSQAAISIFGSDKITSEIKAGIDIVEQVFGICVSFFAGNATWGDNFWESIPEMGSSSKTYDYGDGSTKQVNLKCTTAGANLQSFFSRPVPLYDSSLGIAQNGKQFAELNRLYSGLLFVNDDGDTPEQTYTKARTSGRYITYITSKSATIGGGVQGNKLLFERGYNRFSQGAWGTLLDGLSSSTMEYEEVFKDTDNTYPGGGNDKNTYPDDGESGKGTFDNSNDEIDFPPIPLWDATSTGFISMWNPTITEIMSLYGFLWDSDISTTLKKLFLEPMEAIISLAFFPVDPVNFPDKRNVTIGHVDSGVQMYAVQKQFVDFDFGELAIDEYYGAAWDYSPYTQASIYLPYIGTQALDIDDVMNGTLHLKYRIDLLSGMCAAMLRVDRSRDGLQAVIYTWQGNCAMQIPVTAGSAREFLNSIIQLGAMAGVSMAQPLAGAIDASMHKGDENYESSIMGNNWINPTIATFSALNVIGQKVRVQRGGRVDANAGVMSPQEAYIILNRPISAIPKGWNQYAGYPSLKIKNLSTQKGYTEVAYIKLNGLEATSEEIMELDGMLKGGVIL